MTPITNDINTIYSFPENHEEEPQKEIDYPNSTYLVVSKVGYLLGVPKRFF